MAYTLQKNVQDSLQPECSGPCFDRCYRCPWPLVALANMSIVYLVASAVYVAATQFVGTPFGDSLTEEQRELKRRSAQTRGKIFLFGVCVGVGVIALLLPMVKSAA